MQITEAANEDLKSRAEGYRCDSVADSTKKTRAGQWGIYKKTCVDFGWPVYPCSLEQACMYVSHLAKRLKFSSVKSYYQAVIFYHVCVGLEPVRMSNPILCATLKGIEKSKGGEGKGKDPILPHHLKRIVSVCNFPVELEFLVCVAALLMFRTLLRVSHIVKLGHTLMRGDVKFTQEGCTVRVSSSKTTTERDFAVMLPVLFSNDKTICPVTWLIRLVKSFGCSKEAFLFSSPSIPVLTYSMFARNSRSSPLGLGCTGISLHTLLGGAGPLLWQCSNDHWIRLNL